MFRKVFFLSIVFILCLFACAKAARLVWDANTESDLAGYKVYRGQSSGSYDHIVDVGNVTEHQIDGLDSGTYYYAVTAYNTGGAESGFSNEVVYVEGSQAIAAATDVKVAYKEASAMTLEYKGITTEIASVGDVNQNIEIPSGSTLALICISGYLDTRESMASSVSVDSQSASLAVYEAGSGDEEMSEIWHVRGFATGTKNLTIDFKSAVYGCHIYVVFFSGENPTTPVTSPLTDLGSNVSIELTTVSGDIGLILLADFDNDGSLDQNSQTVIADGAGAEYSDYPDIAYKAATGASLTLTGTNSAGGSACAVTIKAAAAAGAALEQKAFRGINRGIMRGAM